MNTQTNIRIIITLVFLALLSACGSSTSHDEIQDLASNGITPSKPIAKCTKAGTSTLSYKVAAQISGSSFDPNWANVFLSNLTPGFEDSTSDIQFIKGQATGDRTITYASAPVPFAIYDRQSAGYLNGGTSYTSFKWSDVKDLISGATPASFMSRVILVLSLQDPTGAYQVLTAVSHTTSDHSLIEAIPSLLPTFYANPADYAIGSNGLLRPSILRDLHPLKNQTGDFASLANSLCL